MAFGDRHGMSREMVCSLEDMVCRLDDSVLTWYALSTTYHVVVLILDVPCAHEHVPCADFEHRMFKSIRHQTHWQEDALVLCQRHPGQGPYKFEDADGILGCPKSTSSGSNTSTLRSATARDATATA
jgi:hypothetical protein